MQKNSLPVGKTRVVCKCSERIFRMHVCVELMNHSCLRGKRPIHCRNIFYFCRMRWRNSPSRPTGSKSAPWNLGRICIQLTTIIWIPNWKHWEWLGGWGLLRVPSWGKKLAVGARIHKKAPLTRRLVFSRDGFHDPHCSSNKNDSLERLHENAIRQHVIKSARQGPGYTAPLIDRAITK